MSNWSNANDILKAGMHERVYFPETKEATKLKDDPAVKKKVEEEFAKFKKKASKVAASRIKGGKITWASTRNQKKNWKSWSKEKLRGRGGAQRFTHESLLGDYLSSKADEGWDKFTKPGREALETYKEAQRNAPTVREVIEEGKKAPRLSK